MGTFSHIHSFKFQFPDLGIEVAEIESLLGFEAGLAFDPYPQYIREVFEVAQNLKNINGSYVLFDRITIEPKSKQIHVEGEVFETGKIITTQIQKATAVALFVCTAGYELEEFSKQQMKLGNAPEAYIADLAGSVIVEAAMDRVQEKLAKDMREKGLTITNRYSPGYCGWQVQEQQKLFRLLPEGLCDINLNESSLMQPVKSVSGIIGIGSEVRFNSYTCKICDMKDCIYRNRKHRK